MENKLLVSSSPHMKNDESTRGIMGTVFYTLFIPVSILAYMFFGPRSLVITLISIAACVVFEHLYCVITKKPTTVGDLSAIVTGVLLAFNLPVTVPLWIPVIGAFFAIVIVKCLFGGLGQNFANPALAARVFLLLSFSQIMTTWVPAVEGANTLPLFSNVAADVTTQATPLAQLKAGAFDFANLKDLLFGNIGGCIGETCALILALGGVYLVIRKVITWHIPVSFIGTVALITFIFPQGYDRVEFMLANVLGGGLMLGAIYMATDYSSSPISANGKLIFGVGCGLITVLIRYFGGYPEGVSFAILTMNCFTWMIDKNIKARRYGSRTKEVLSK